MRIGSVFEQEVVVGHRRQPRVVTVANFDLNVGGQVLTNGGPGTGKLVFSVEFIVVDGDYWWSLHTLTQHFSLFQSDGKSEV